MKNAISRRSFLRRSSLAVGAFWIGSAGYARSNPPGERLNIGIIGTANRSKANIGGVKHHNIVAICDVDETFLNAAAKDFPQAKRYQDFRKLMEQRDVDAVVISTTDHTHAIATAAALRSGRHVYCEKPLTHTVHEARLIRKLAAKHKKLATQMGTQIHAGDNYRRVVELVESGAIGDVTECHVWCSKSKPGTMPAAFPPVPSTLDWDLWLGPAAARPYSPEYHPKNWRTFWAFGGGCLGDMACHFMDLPFWALKLTHPLTIEAEGPPVHDETTPGWLTVHYEYPRRGKQPAVRLHWYDGGRKPQLVAEGRAPNWENGVLFVGSEGMLVADYGKHRLLPEESYKDFKPPTPYIPSSIGHYEEWLQACKTGAPTSCNFDYAGVLTEAVLLGNVAYRSGEKLVWDAAAMKVKNTRAAHRFIEKEYRKGWAI